MKPFLIMLISLSFTLTASGQRNSTTSSNDTAKKHLGLVPKIDILPPAASIFENNIYLGFSLEKEIIGHFSIQLTYQYSAVDVNYLFATYQSQIIPECRYYIGKAKKHEGVYIGGHGEIILQRHVYNRYMYNPSLQPQISYETDWAVGLNIGFKKYIGKRVSLDLLVGDGLVIWPNYDYILDQQYGRLSLDVGYRF